MFPNLRCPTHATTADTVVTNGRRPGAVPSRSSRLGVFSLMWGQLGVLPDCDGACAGSGHADISLNPGWPQRRANWRRPLFPRPWRIWSRYSGNATAMEGSWHCVKWGPNSDSWLWALGRFPLRTVSGAVAYQKPTSAPSCKVPEASGLARHPNIASSCQASNADVLGRPRRSSRLRFRVSEVV